MQPKSCRSLVSLLILVAGLAPSWGCAGIRDDAPLPAPADEPYTLRIVFSGLVPLVVDEDAESPGPVTALLPNFETPKKLQLGRLIHQHQNRLVFDRSQVMVDTGGRKIDPKGWVCDCKDDGGPDSQWSYITLEDEDLDLLSDNPDGVKVAHGDLALPMPCDPGTAGCGVHERSKADQERDVRWMIDLDDVMDGLAREGEPAPRIRPDLLEPSYHPDGLPLLAARYRFESGTLQSRWLLRRGNQCQGDYERYLIAPADDSVATGFVLDQALARDVEIELTRRGPTVFSVRRLSDASDRLDPIVIQPRAGRKEVVIHIDNHPKVSSCAHLAAHMKTAPRRVDDLHFLALYNLLDHPESLPTPDFADSILSPFVSGPPSWNGQCSPPLVGSSLSGSEP